MMQQTHKYLKLVAISMFVMINYPILLYYNTFGYQLTYASVILLFTAVLMGKLRNINSLLVFYFVYWMFSAFHIYFIAGAVGWSDDLLDRVNFALFTMTIHTFVVIFDEQLATKYLRWIFIVSFIMFLIQFVTYYSAHGKIFFFLPLENKLTYSGLSYSELVTFQSLSISTDINRFSSIKYKAFPISLALLFLLVSLIGDHISKWNHGNIYNVYFRS